MALELEIRLKGLEFHAFSSLSRALTVDDMVISRLIFYFLLKRVLASCCSAGVGSLTWAGLSYLEAFLIGCKFMLVMDFELSVLRLGLGRCYGFLTLSTPLFYRVGDGLLLAAPAVSFAASAPLFAVSAGY